MLNRRRTLLATAAGLTASHWLPASAQDFPSKPITLVVPYSAGGATDVSARRLAEEMTKTLNTPVVIENKPGAGSFIAATAVTKAARDGYTLLFAGPGVISLNPHVFRSLPYRVEELTPVSTFSKQAFVINGNPAIPVKTVADLIAYAKSRPEGVSFGTVGTGTTSHVIAEWVVRTLGINAVFVPYKGTAQSTVDLMGGRIDVQVDGISTAMIMHKAGKTRVVASMGAERSILPEGVQTFVEAGFPSLVAYAQFAVLAPAGTPEAVIRKLHGAVQAAANNPAVVNWMRGNGELPDLTRSPEAFGELIRSEYERWGAIVRPMNLNL